MRLTIACLLACLFGLLLPGCSVSVTKPSTSIGPPIDVVVASEHRMFFVTPGQTVRVPSKTAAVDNPDVMAAVHRESDATVFKAKTLGRAYISTNFAQGSCQLPCSHAANFLTQVMVVGDLNRPIEIGEPDEGWDITAKSGETFLIKLEILPFAPKWAFMTSANPEVMAPQRPAVAAPDSLRAWFRATKPGTAEITAGEDCPPTDCARVFFRFDVTS